MAVNKQYIFKVTKREAFDGTKFANHTSKTFKNKRKALKEFHNFDYLEGKECGGCCSFTIKRVR